MCVYVPVHSCGMDAAMGTAEQKKNQIKTDFVYLN